MNASKIKTYAGFEFAFRQSGLVDQPLVAEFWTHVSRKNVAARFLGQDDPTRPGYVAQPAVHPHETTSTFLAIGGDGSVISVAIMIAEREQKTARVMVFTRDGITSHGISWALLARVLEEARAGGMETVRSVFDAADLPAIRLELKMGFVESPYPDHPDLRLLQWTWPGVGQQV